jgi:Domain of unknown function (DUF4845)
MQTKLNNNHTYKPEYKSIKNGFGYTDFILILLLILSLIVPLAYIVPTYIEYYGLKKAINHVQKNTTNEKDARAALMNQFSIDQFRSITPEDILIEKDALNNEKLILSFDYKQAIPLYGNLSLLMHYKATTDNKIIPKHLKNI